MLARSEFRGAIESSESISTSLLAFASVLVKWSPSLHVEPFSEFFLAHMDHEVVEADELQQATIKPLSNVFPSAVDLFIVY